MGKSGKRFKTGCVYSKKLPPAVRRQKKGSQLAAHNQGYVPDRYPLRRGLKQNHGKVLQFNKRGLRDGKKFI
ncbi:hypothetical protein HMPREF3293_01278 [Christensenella minuta]|uniref:Uncharacterized protein n=1 Tax=Christensenella minuta TaxID=626937 RepID=A0A136Q528_9FIRM|nr:hypothetical protein HMPREF3293_01278 [Christensenella minuta]